MNWRVVVIGLFVLLTSINILSFYSARPSAPLLSSVNDDMFGILDNIVTSDDDDDHHLVIASTPPTDNNNSSSSSGGATSAPLVVYDDVSTRIEETVNHVKIRQNSPFWITLLSPSMTARLEVSLRPFLGLSNCLMYRFFYDAHPVVAWSPFLAGFYSKKGSFFPTFSFDRLPKSPPGPGFTRYHALHPLCDLRLVEHTVDSHFEEWTTVVGEADRIFDSFLLFDVSLVEEINNITLSATFRVYDQGVAARLSLGADLWLGAPEGKDVLVVASSFRFQSDGVVHIDRGAEKGFLSLPLHEEVTAEEPGWRFPPMHPAMVELESGVTMAVTEARNLDFLDLRFMGIGTFEDVIAGFRKTAPGDGAEPIVTPWTLSLLGKTPADVVNARQLVYNLNDPCEIEDPGWIKPGKVLRDMQLSTETSLQMIELLEMIGGKYVLLDAGWYGPETDPASDATHWLPNPKKGALDVKKVVEEGRRRGIGVILYVNDIALKLQLDDILRAFVSWGVAGIKFGFVSLETSSDVARILGYVRRCAEHKLVVNIHDYYRPSGFSRTYPNLLSIEGIRGDEHTPEAKHAVTLPFMRFIAGQADHTFVFAIERLRKMGKSPTHQVALPIVMYDPLQHLFWYLSPGEILMLLTTYEQLEVWKDMPTVWARSLVLAGEVGEYIAVARKATSGDWFIAAVTESPRDVAIGLGFLEDEHERAAVRYRDNPADPYLPGIRDTFKVSRRVTLTMRLGQGSGEVLVVKNADNGFRK